jgi:transposase-like protein
MTNDLSLNTLDKNQAIQEILQMRREIARLQDQFGINNTELEQAVQPTVETPQPLPTENTTENPTENPTENTTYEHGKKVGAWLKNVLK